MSNRCTATAVKWDGVLDGLDTGNVREMRIEAGKPCEARKRH